MMKEHGIFGIISLLRLLFYADFLNASYYVMKNENSSKFKIIKTIRVNTLTSCILKCSMLDNCDLTSFEETDGETICHLLRKIQAVESAKNKTGILTEKGRNAHLNSKDDAGTFRTMTEVKSDVMMEQQIKWHSLQVNGGFTDWIKGMCTVSCGGGFLTESRTCNNPAPLYGGEECRGEVNRTVECNAHPCLINGGFSRWIQGNCSVPCGGGLLTETRTCNNPAPKYGGKDCYGDKNRTIPCNEHHCKINGGFSPWIQGNCSVPCGGGLLTETRTCNNPAPQYGGKDCHGEQNRTIPCNEHQCINIPHLRWPEGSYGILSRDPCPVNWFEFNQCLDIESKVEKFELDLGTCDASNTSLTFRYCFKGANIPSRSGGFWTKTGRYGNAFVVKNVEGNCSMYGNRSGAVYIDGDDNHSIQDTKFGNDSLNGKYHPKYHPLNARLSKTSNVHIEFCEIGAPRVSSPSEYIDIGEFRQIFGFFSHPDRRSCPVLKSPYGMLGGRRDEINVISEQDNPNSRTYGDAIPFVIREKKYIRFAVCVYNTSNTLNEG